MSFQAKPFGMPGATKSWIAKMILSIGACFVIHTYGLSQDVSIGTTTPQKKLSVAGFIMIDHDNDNHDTLDSAPKATN